MALSNSVGILTLPFRHNYFADTTTKTPPGHHFSLGGVTLWIRTYGLLLQCVSINRDDMPRLLLWRVVKDYELPGFGGEELALRLEAGLYGFRKAGECFIQHQLGMNHQPRYPNILLSIVRYPNHATVIASAEPVVRSVVPDKVGPRFAPNLLLLSQTCAGIFSCQAPATTRDTVA